MFEKALAKYHIAPEKSWMVGDQLRDMQAAEKVKVTGILVGPHPPTTYAYQKANLWEATQFIVNQK